MNQNVREIGNVEAKRKMKTNIQKNKIVVSRYLTQTF